MKCNLNIIIDTSFSMSVGKLEAINRFFKDEFGEVLEQMDFKNKDSITLSVVSFNDKAKWILKDQILKEKLEWIDLEASGRTNINNAINLLLNNFNNEDYNFNLLISDGYFDEIHEQTIKTKEIRYGLLIGSEYKETRDKMEKYTGEGRRVITLYFSYDVKKVFRIILDSILKAEDLDFINDYIYRETSKIPSVKI